MTSSSPGLRDALADLLTGSRCVGCERAGAMLCTACAAALPAQPQRVRLAASPCPVPVWAAAEHEGVPRSLVVGLKEEGRWSHASVLGRLLATSVEAALGASLGAAAASGPLLLCPVPGRPGTARRRGGDPTAAILGAAVHTLRARRRGASVHAVDLLVSHRGVRDQSELGAAARAANLAGSLWCPSARLRAVRRRHRAGHVIVCDDVVTTGATLAEAVRALAAVGVPVLAGASVTATPRRFPGHGAGSATTT